MPLFSHISECEHKALSVNGFNYLKIQLLLPIYYALTMINKRRRESKTRGEVLLLFGKSLESVMVFVPCGFLF